MRRDFISSLQRGWISVLRSPIASYSAVLIAVTLSRTFQGALGDDTVNPLLRRIVWSVDPTPDVFRAEPVGVGASYDSAFHTVTVCNFFCEVPGCCTSRQNLFRQNT